MPALKYWNGSAWAQVMGGGAGQGADTEEFLPANAATTVTLSQTPTDVLLVTRDGIVQSYVDGHWTQAGAVLTFTDAFNGTERVQVTYLAGTIGAVGPMGPSASVHEEFMPAASATVITLSQACQALLLVARNGVVQSATSGNYSIAGNIITFTDAFLGTERVVVEYALQTATASPPFNGSGLTDGSITSAKLADGSVTTAKLAASAAQQYLGGYISGGSSPVYAQGAWVETAIQVTVTTSGGYVRIEAGAQLYMQALGYVMYGIGWDGTMQAALGTIHEQTANNQIPVTFVYYHLPAAGTRRYAVWVNPQGATVTIWNGVASWMWVNEQKR